MPGRKTSKTLKEYEESYKQQRSLLWGDFNEQLNRLQHNYGVTVTELAEGLGISRQKFYDFRASPEKGLAIDRTALMILWGWLTDPDILDDKRMSAETRKQRDDLRQEGPNALLISAGFLPISGESEAGDSTSIPRLDSSLKRVEARLNSPWIEDGIRRAQIIDSILDEVKARGRLDKAFHTQPMSAAAALTWLKGAPLYITSPKIIHEYQRKIRRLARSGKSQFVGVELFELYQNILEYQTIDSYAGSGVSVVDCQFPILSAPLPASVQEIFEPFSSIYRDAEIALLTLLCDLQDFAPTELTSSDLFTPVVRALIKSQFDIGEKPVVWRYSSTGTHFENMLSALKFGLGHSLDMTGFSIQATGTTSKSLARVSVGLAECDEAGKISRVYQGWWVDSNAVTAVLVANVIATKDWLSSQGADLSEYFDICSKLGDIDNRLYLIRENVQEYFFRNANGYFESPEGSDDDSTFDTIKAKLSEIEQTLSSEQLSRPYYRTQHQAVKNRLTRTNLTQMRLALKNSELGKANQTIDEAKEYLSHYENANLSEMNEESDENAYRHLLFLQASECVMLYNFYAGDREFLSGKLWRYRPRYKLDEGLKKLGKYLKVVGSLNFDAFSCASQMFGTAGLLELYMAEEKDAAFLQQAAKHLLWAAHYSQRIGYVRRATYWLTHASRVYCRLGDLDSSERLSQIAQVAADSVHQNNQEELEYDSKFKVLIAAITHLAEGERLLVKEEPEQAHLFFFRALKLFMDTHFTDRLMADALYGLYQASRYIEGEVGDVFTVLSDEGEHTQFNQGMGAVLQNITRSLKQIKSQSSWKSEAHTFKELAKTVWRYWVQVGNETADVHPIEEAIDRDRFLTLVKSS
ncbi:MAG: hypothetical protein AAFN42_20675 [Cyanobacteria bacterium J06554_1]